MKTPSFYENSITLSWLHSNIGWSYLANLAASVAYAMPCHGLVRNLPRDPIYMIFVNLGGIGKNLFHENLSKWKTDPPREATN